MPTTKKKSTKSPAKSDEAAIDTYSNEQSPPFRAMCEQLRTLINTTLPKATSKVWHGSPVWFIDDNPVIGYSTTAKSVNLLFWNGQALDEPDLKPVGKHGAAQASFTSPEEINDAVAKRLLKKAGTNVLDSKAYFKKLREQRKPKAKKK